MAWKQLANEGLHGWTGKTGAGKQKKQVTIIIWLKSKKTMWDSCQPISWSDLAVFRLVLPSLCWEIVDVDTLSDFTLLKESEVILDVGGGCWVSGSWVSQRQLRSQHTDGHHSMCYPMETCMCCWAGCWGRLHRAQERCSHVGTLPCCHRMSHEVMPFARWALSWHLGRQCLILFPFSNIWEMFQACIGASGRHIFLGLILQMGLCCIRLVSTWLRASLSNHVRLC